MHIAGYGRFVASLIRHADFNWNSMNINEIIHSALQHYHSGNLQLAEQIFKTALERSPDNSDILYFLGIIYSQSKNYDLAIQHIQRSLQSNANNINAYLVLGMIFEQKGLLDEAVMSYQKAIQYFPDSAELQCNLGNIFKEIGQFDEAILHYQKSLQLNPVFAEAHTNLGIAFYKKGQLDEAITCYKEALEINPDSAILYNNLGLAFEVKGQRDQAIICYQKVLQLDPDFAGAYGNLGNILLDNGNLNEAIDCYQKTLQLNPNSAEAITNIGIALCEQGKLKEADTLLRRAVQINTDYSVGFSKFLFFINYNYAYDAETIFIEHQKFSKQFAEPLSYTITPHIKNQKLNGRLKIGYISPDFRRHPVAFFIEPVLMTHNQDNFEIFCYSDVIVSDEVTKRIQGYSNQWRNITGMSDQKAAEIIRNDRIEILVDLAGHTEHNRMLLFARKPAPVQVSMIGYPATTGISAIDYKIVDCYTDPPGMTEQFYTEKLIRLSESFLCYLPEKDSPKVDNLPALTGGYITFGSFNKFAKVSLKVLSLWIEILKTIPDSHLIMKAKSLADRSTREYVIDTFKHAGISEERIELLPFKSSARHHLEVYNRIDIGLDTFPYNGTTTTCEAAWMGVPVITLAGNTHASRVGLSLLTNIGLSELVALTPDEYVKIAVDLAKDLNRLKSLRKGLRDMISHSPLTDAKKYTANLEKSYRRMWETWCTY